MKKRTLAVLSELPDPMLELLKRALRGETVDVTAPRNVTVQSSRMHGAVGAVVGMMRSVGLDRAISARKRIEQQTILALVPTSSRIPPIFRSKLPIIKRLGYWLGENLYPCQFNFFFDCS